MVILVVDEDPLSRRILQFLLEGEGFEVALVENIRGARAFLVETTPLVILLDVHLPDGDGFAFCQWLSREEPQVPVVILTAFVSQPDKLKGFDSGADDYITRPYDPHELLARLKAVLRRTSRARSHLVQDVLRVGNLELLVNELKVKGTGPEI